MCGSCKKLKIAQLYVNSSYDSYLQSRIRKSSKKVVVTSIKNDYRKLQEEVGMVTPKSTCTQTGVVWMITKYNRHP